MPVQSKIHKRPSSAAPRPAAAWKHEMPSKQKLMSKGLISTTKEYKEYLNHFRPFWSYKNSRYQPPCGPWFFRWPVAVYKESLTDVELKLFFITHKHFRGAWRHSAIRN